MPTTRIEKGARAEALRLVTANSERIVLATLPEIDLPYLFSPEDSTVVDWRRDRLVDFDGTPLASLPRPILHEVPYSLTPAELSLWSTVVDVVETLKMVALLPGWMPNLLLSASVESSRSGGCMRKRMEWSPIDSETLSESSEEDVPLIRPEYQMDDPTAAKAAEIGAGALQQIEDAEVDSKLRTFAQLLSDLTAMKTPSRRICVVTDYRASLYYLAAEIEGRAMTCQLLHGDMGNEDVTEP